VVLATNQDIAESIADELRASAQLKDYTINVRYMRGVAQLSGEVVNLSQHDEAIRIAGHSPGVEHVVDELKVVAPLAAKAPTPLVPIQATTPAPQQDGDQVLPAQATNPQPVPAPSRLPLPPAPVTPGAVPPPTALPAPPPGAAPVMEAMPSFQAPAPSAYDLNPPRMPPYAWPTYAPYNNYSRVAYPTAYPYNAWPFIGPCYPFPKIPPGWRAIKLEWRDGYWWYSKLMPKYDWWRLRFY
jgi:hypothetical protein